MLRVESIVSVPFQENTFVFWIEGKPECFIVDPGMQPKKIVELVEAHGLTPEAVLLTHGHSDHIFGNQAMKDRWPDVPLVIGHGDAYKLTDPEANLSAGFGFPLITPTADRTVAEGAEQVLAGVPIRVLETPGHSAGHVAFVAEHGGQTHVISGDVLFRGGVGRTDFFDGDTEQLLESIREKLFPLPDDAVVYPGHGPTTTIGFEREHNPFAGAAAGRL
ncbi:MAG: MBL fold metallo-hydrolase [Planctomycetota bacterium]